MTKSFVATGECAQCGAKLGLAHQRGVTDFLIMFIEDFMGDEDLRVYCPKCQQFTQIKDMRLEMYEKNEVKRMIERGDPKL